MELIGLIRLWEESNGGVTMGKCTNNQCFNETQGDNPYCYECYKKWRELNQGKKKTEWNENPQIDVLMKINANLGNISQHLERIANNIEKVKKK